ncbi:rhomboid-like protein 14, mitochondrial [Cryptomeria japonica]|uniref:rhomboid-like protein 14, mitochondrial n=1 Tax=Cryptomeria japonica TaxID=3369 RepID=UPI0025AD6206|nr:rhomboid-like protein 14, mitochondrial [Cryptomeria japonica]
MDMPITVSLAALMVVICCVFPQFAEDTCTDTKKFDLNGWFMPIFHRVSKGQLAYQIASLLWKGTLLEELMGSRRFASMILKLFLTREVIVLIAAQGWQFWDLANIYSSIYHGQLWRIFFGMYGFLLPAYPSRNALIISTIFAAELAFVHLLFPTIPLSVPVCDTLVGFLWSYAPQYVIRRRKMFLMIETNERSATGGLVWICHSCRSENGVFLDVCESCGTPHGNFAYDNSVMDGSQSSLINGTPNRELRTDLVWICTSCTLENGVFVDVCDNCKTPNGVIGYNDPVMENLQSPLISRRPNPEIDSTSLVWNCESCSSDNGVFFNACENCQTPRPTTE